MENINVLRGPGGILPLIQDRRPSDKTLWIPVGGQHTQDFRFKRTNGHGYASLSAERL